METENNIKNIFSKANTPTLTQEEKSVMRSVLMAYMKENPVRVPFTQRAINSVSSFAQFVTLQPIARYSMAMLMIAVFFGTGISFAAQKSLPGDFLYPIKTRVNEKVLGFTLFSSEAKTQYELNLVQTRLQEIKKVAVGNKLDNVATKEINTLLGKHITSVKARTKNAKDVKKSEIETNSEVEAYINGYLQVLDALPSTNQKISGPMQEVIKNLQETSVKLLRERQGYESDLSLQREEKLKLDAEKKLIDYQAAMQAANELIIYHQKELSPTMIQKVQDNFATAEAHIAEGQKKFQEKDYKDSLILFQNGLRKIKEVKIYVEQEVNN